MSAVSAKSLLNIAPKPNDDLGSTTTKSPSRSPRKSKTPANILSTSPSKESPSKRRTRQTTMAEEAANAIEDLIVVDDDSIVDMGHNDHKPTNEVTQQTSIFSYTISASDENNEDLETTAAAFAAAQHHTLPPQSSTALRNNNYFESLTASSTEYGQITTQNVLNSLLTKDEQDSSISNLQNSLPNTQAQPVDATSQFKRRREVSMLKSSSRRIVVKAPLLTSRLPKRSTQNPPHINGNSNGSENDYNNARALLHVSAIPDALPCRDREFSQLFIALEGAIKNKTGSCLYVSGTPGTGKTATVREVLAQLQLRIDDGTPNSLPYFTTLEINGMKLINPQESYEVLWQHITGQRVSAQNAVGLLEKEFKTNREGNNSRGTKGHRAMAQLRNGCSRMRAEDLLNEASMYSRGGNGYNSNSGGSANGLSSQTLCSSRPPVVVIMDELDQLVTKNQNIVYNFFNWPSLPHSKLIVIAIANTMDLPERTFTNKIASRLGLTRFIFPGYSYEQLQEIITSRLGNYVSLIQREAIEFAARKVASVSGDARRALDICRRAFELAEVDVDTGSSGSTLAAEVAASLDGSNGDGIKKSNETLTHKNIVKIKHIKQAIDETTNSFMKIYLQGLPLAAKIFLSAVLARIRRSCMNENSMSDILEETQRLCKVSPQADKLMDIFYKAPGGSGIAGGNYDGISNIFGSNDNNNGGGTSGVANNERRRIRMAGFLNAVSELSETGIIVQQAIKGERNARIRLTVAEDEVKNALKDDPDVESMI